MWALIRLPTACHRTHIPVMAAHLQRAAQPSRWLGGTVMVGDPTGKTEMRQMLTREIVKNAEAIKSSFRASSTLAKERRSW